MPGKTCVLCGEQTPSRELNAYGECIECTDEATWKSEPTDCSGAFDGFQVTSDADPGL